MYVRRLRLPPRTGQLSSYPNHSFCGSCYAGQVLKPVGEILYPTAPQPQPVDFQTPQIAVWSSGDSPCLETSGHTDSGSQITNNPTIGHLGAMCSSINNASLICGPELNGDGVVSSLSRCRQSYRFVNLAPGKPGSDTRQTPSDVS